MKKKFIDRKNKMIAQKNQFVKEVAQSLADSLVLSMGMVVSKAKRRQLSSTVFY